MEGYNAHNIRFIGNKPINFARNEVPFKLVDTNLTHNHINYNKNSYPYSFSNWEIVNYLMDKNKINNFNYIKLGNKTINGKEYQSYRLQNGTIVNIRQDKDLKYNTISTSLKNSVYNPNRSDNKFLNLTEAHLFEHMFADFSLNNGYFQNIDDGDFGESIRFIVKTDENESIKNIVDKQVNKIYSANFSREIFNREKQALNIELYNKNNWGLYAGDRNELKEIDLNRLRQIRNNLVKPSNIEIIIDSKASPQKILSDILQTNANIKVSQIQKLPDISYEQIELYNGNEAKDIEFVALSDKPKDFDDKKMVTVLALIKTFALTDDKTNLILNTRELCYGVNIFVEKDKSGKFIFRYCSTTFNQNADKQKQKYDENFEEIMKCNFTDEDIENAKKSLKFNLERFYNKQMNKIISKEEMQHYIDTISSSDIKTVIKSLKK